MTYDFASPGTCSSADSLGPSLGEICNSSRFIVFMTILNELVRYNEKISGACDRVKPIEEPREEYDFVVIGGGAAGSVIAGRLSENPDWSVLLLEAGPDEPVGAQVPGLNDQLIGTRVDWNFTATNESYACLSTNGTCPISASKMLGGGTAHNGMIYIRGNPTDYNNWAELGNEGWEWENVLKYFKKAEDNGEIGRVGRVYHATRGPLPVQRFPYVPPLGRSILKASDEIGYGVSADLNGKQITGFALAQTTSKNGVRISSAAAYLRPIRNRKNFHVSLESTASKVIIKNGVVVGVEYFQNGELKTVRVSHEVIVSASTIKSPQILLLSGIGPNEHLKSLGVKVIQDLPGVGENLHDHIAFVLNFTINEPDKFDNDYNIATEYLVNQTGPLSCGGLNQVMSTLKSKSASPDYPDIQLYFNGYSSTCAPGEVDALRSTGRRNVAIRAVFLHTKSRGRISLASSDPLEDPIIWFNAMSDSSDVNGLVEAVELGLALRKTKAMRAHKFTLTTTPIEACSDHTFPSTEYWACAVRQNPAPLELHAAGSCKMGPASDPMAVVDHRLRVHGIKGLRVADTSIMPQVTSGNTAAPTMMIGERAADFIKEDWAREFGRKDCAPIARRLIG